jgi:DNA replication factor GINS
MMDLEELRTVQTRERATEGLQELRDSFYADVARYIESLREERRRAAEEAADPFRSQEVTELSDEIETAEQVAEAIYERRIGKLVKRASLAAAGMPDDQAGLTAEEQDLYDALVDRIEENKARVLETLSGDREPDAEGEDSTAEPAGTPDPPPTSQAESQSEDGSAATAMMNAEPPAENPPEDPTADDEQDEDVAGDAGAEGSSVERTKVRVTEDVGEIFGVDERAYDLKSDDVVHLPTENAVPLLDRDAAEKLE